MNYTIEEIDTIMSVVLNSVLIIATVFGSIWAYHKFYSIENRAGLSINFIDINYTKAKNNKYYLNVTLNIKNIGKRELEILLKETKITLYKKTKNNLNYINSFSGRYSEESEQINARIRSEVDYNFPYSFIIKEKGRYFIEFTVKTNMDKYKSLTSIFFSKTRRLFNKGLRFLTKAIFWKKIKIIDRDIKFIRWHEKTYFIID